MTKAIKSHIDKLTIVQRGIMLKELQDEIKKGTVKEEDYKEELLYLKEKTKFRKPAHRFNTFYLPSV